MYHVPSELLDLFAGLFDDNATAKLIAEQAGLPAGFINFSGPVTVVWNNILKEALKQHAVSELIAIASSKYPKLDWKEIGRLVCRTDSTIAAKNSPLDDASWHGPSSQEELEALTGPQSTLLPIHFFEVGLAKARSVALVRLPSGSGTGFLIEHNLLITNNHVIADRDQARVAEVVFNHHSELNGKDSTPTIYSLAPEDGFVTSVGDDWTAVRIKGDANSLWGAIPIRKCVVIPKENVNIIQHAMGGPKVVALYHNVVVFADINRIQYLTDTLPGSSGSPVFRSDWSIVGLHHSSAMHKDHFSGAASVRNQGIPIAIIIDGLTREGLMKA